MRIVALFVAFACALANAADAQPAPRVARIGYLATTSPEHAKSRLAAFRQGLRDLGHVEGGDVVVEVRYASTNDAARAARELVRLPVDVLVTAGTPAAMAAKNATKTIPIVIGYAADPMNSELVGDLARPTGNITGFSDGSAEVASKRLELLKPALSSPKVAVWVNPNNPTNSLELKRMEVAAANLAVTIVPFRIANARDMQSAIAAMRKDRIGGLLLTGDSLWGVHRDTILALEKENRLPVMYTGLEAVDHGGLMAYAANFDELNRRAAAYVDKILKGAKPASLPIEQPAKYELIVNQRTARSLGIVLPESILVQADRIID